MLSKKIFFTAQFIFGAIALCSAQYSTLFSDGQNTYIQVDHQVSKMNKKGNFEELFRSDSKMNDAVYQNGKFWVSTEKGVEIFDGKTLQKEETIFQNTPSAAIETDANGKIWIATKYKGVYQQNAVDSKEFILKMNVPTSFSLASTPDKNMYVGTNIGLYKINIDTNKMIRYAEEAHSGHGLPDNYVERLFADRNSNIWVIMPDNIAFQKSDNFMGEIPTFSFVGNSENKVHQIVGLKDQSFIFVTEQGVMLLPSKELKGHHHQEEVFNAKQTAAFLLDNQKLNAPKNMLGAKVTNAEIINGEIVFFTKEGSWKIKENKFLKKMG